MSERIMFSGKPIGLAIILVSAFAGGCANRDASLHVVNQTNEPIVLEPVVKTAFLSKPLEKVQLAPGQEWDQSWALERGSWVLVRFVRPDDINSTVAGSLCLRTVRRGEVVAVRATPDENGILSKIISE
jgi:hypothetical protein